MNVNVDMNIGEHEEKNEIPKIIYICHKNLQCLTMTHKFWKKINPTYEIKLYNDVMCEQFLLNEMSQLHQSIFKFIPDGPIKSDFWRLCILYKYGGIYVDADIHPLMPLDNYLLRSSDFVTCITKSNGNFNPHFIAAKKNDFNLKKCIEEYIDFYTHHKPYTYSSWSIVDVFNKVLSNIKTHHNKMPSLQVFSHQQKKYQIFFETTTRDDSYDKNSIDKIMTQSHGLHDYYCTFLNKRIFNTRYLNYDPDNHMFKKYIIKNRNQNHNILGFNLNVNLSKRNDLKKMKKI